MDIILGIRVQDSVILASSKAVTRGISVLKDSDDKTRQLSPHTLMSFAGEAGDTVQFAEYIQANIQLYSIREDYELSPQAVSSFVRQELAKSIRSRRPYQVNVLIGGYDKKKNKPELYQIDYLGHYRPDMTTEEGLDLLKLCVQELEKRMPMDFKGVIVKIVDKDGIRQVDDFQAQ